MLTTSPIVRGRPNSYHNLMIKTSRRKGHPYLSSDRKARGLLAVGVSLPKIAAPALRKRGFAQARLITDWPAIVGEKLANETMPQKLVFQRSNRGDGILHLRVSPAYALELQHIAPQVIERINAFFGYRAVADFRYQQGPVLPRRKPRQVEPNKLIDADENRLQRSLSGISDIRLRDALLGLGRAVGSSRKPK